MFITANIGCIINAYFISIRKCVSVLACLPNPHTVLVAKTLKTYQIEVK